MRKKVSIVIPVYNEVNTISKVLERITNTNCYGLKKEVVIVDDASTDGTTKLIKKKLASINKNRKINTSFIYLTKKNNEGKGFALRDGFLKTSGDIVIVQDADLEYSPDDYEDLTSPFLSKNADVVYGSRFVTNKPHRVLYFWHYLVNLTLTFLSNLLTNLNLSDMETGFKVFRGDLIRNLAPKLKSKGFGFEPEITALIARIKGIRIYEVGISYEGRTYEEGKKITWIDGIKAVVQIVRFNIFS
jgi:glycosyltransferase involved in cell wall biosynthesis